MTRALLLDEMISPTIADQLRQRGRGAYAITERPDLVGLPDEQVLGLGADEDRVLVTLNIADLRGLWPGRGAAAHDRRWMTSGADLVIVVTMASTLPLAEVKSHLSELVGRVADQHERVTVTVHGRPSAVLLAVDDLEALEKTIAVLSDRERRSDSSWTPTQSWPGGKKRPRSSSAGP